jgi:hypothetical protein
VMKGLLLVLLAVFGASVLSPAGAYAHTLEADNGVSAVLHIAPDDNPQAAQDTTLDFSFSSQEPGFDIRYCGCKVSFASSSDRLYSTSISSIQNSASSGYAVVNFPKGGVYDLTVQGYTSGQLQDRFKLTYRVRVTPQSSPADSLTSPKSLQVILLGVTGLVLLGILAVTMISGGNRYKAKPRK